MPNIKARIQSKHDIESNWKQATGFSPLAGEIIIYDPDSNYSYPRFKVGDGKTNVNDLPFSTSYNKIVQQVESLPETVNESSPSFIQTPDGKVYWKKAVEAVSLIGAWVFNNTIDISTEKEFIVTFVSGIPAFNGKRMQIHTSSNPDGIGLVYYGSVSERTPRALAYNGTWEASKAYDIIQITDISALTNKAEFTSWLTANATKQDEGVGASVSYEYVAMQEVPTPTTADNGKVLGVTNGAYILQTVSGGEGLKTVNLGEFSGSILTSDSFKTTISVDTELLNNLWEANNISFTLSLSMEGVTISQNISIPITSKIEMMGIKSIEAEGIVQISGGADLEFYDHGYTICRFKQESDAGEYSLIAYLMGDNPATKMPHPHSGDTGKVPVVNSSSNGYELVSYKSTIVDRVGGAPIAVEDSPDFVEVGGTLYCKKASEVTGLTGNWTFNSNASLSAVSGKTFNVNFSSNSSTFNSIVITSSGDGNYIMYYDSTQVHSTKETDDNVTSSNWNNAYQNIQITNTSSLTNVLEFFFWLNENATQTSGSASVSYEYVAQQEVPTPTTSDNGKLLGVENGIYSLQGLNEIQVSMEGGQTLGKVYGPTGPTGAITIPSNTYTLPVATSTTLGGVKPTTKLSSMTQSVGVDSSGRLWTEPADTSSSTSSLYKHIITMSTDIGNGTPDAQYLVIEFLDSRSSITFLDFINLLLSIGNTSKQAYIYNKYDSTDSIIYPIYKDCYILDYTDLEGDGSLPNSKKIRCTLTCMVTNSDDVSTMSACTFYIHGDATIDINSIDFNPQNVIESIVTSNTTSVFDDIAILIQ